MGNMIANSNSGIAVSKMLQIINSHSGIVNVPVKGGLVLPYVNGVSAANSSEAISVTRAIELNNVIERLVGSQRNQLAKMYENYKEGKIEQSEIIKIIKEITIKNNSNQYKQSLRDTQGLLVDAKV